MSYNSTYRSTDEKQQLEEKEQKLTSKLNELGFVTCPQCRKKLVRVFAPRSGQKPVYRDDVSDYMRRMRNAMHAFEKRGAKSDCHISGPEYTVVFNSNHFNHPFSDNLGKGNSHGHCGRGAFLGYSAVDVISRVLLRQRMVRQACISNGVEPDEVRAWLETQKPEDIGTLFGYGFQLTEIEGTDLWAGVYAHSEFTANTSVYDVEAVAGPAWAAERDPVVDDAPPATGHGGKYVMSPTHGCVEYSTSNYKADLALDLPDGVEWNKLVEVSWDRVIQVDTATGVRVKVKVSKQGSAAETINAMTRAMHKLGVPRKFWVIQPESYKGSFEVQDGDIVL